jgi:hypothetical protein
MVSLSDSCSNLHNSLTFPSLYLPIFSSDRPHSRYVLLFSFGLPVLAHLLLRCRRWPSARSTRSESPTSPARLLDFSAALGPNVVVSSAVMICFLKPKATAPAAMTAAAITPKIVARIMSVQFCPLSPFSSCCFALIW